MVSLKKLFDLYEPGPGYSILTLDSSLYLNPNVYLGTLGRLSKVFSGFYAPGPGFLLMRSDLGVCLTILVLGPSPMKLLSVYLPGPTSALNFDSSLHLNLGFLLNVFYIVFGLYLSIPQLPYYEPGPGV